MPVNTFDHAAKFEYFGRKTQRDHDLCPHCGKQGNLIDEGTMLWNERPRASDKDYECATCKGEWVIRRYIYSGFEKYPGPAYAVIYIPQRRK